MQPAKNAIMGGLAGLGDMWLDPRIRFWSDRNAWPEDAQGYIFAGRAIQRFGTHIYGAKWSDEAATSRLEKPLRATLSINMDREELIRGVMLLNAHSTAYSERLKPQPMNVLTSLACDAGGWGELQSPDPYSFADFPTVGEWAEACAIVERLRDESWKKFRPFAMVTLELAKLCREAKILTATRPIIGGAFTPLDASSWNYENAWLRFEECRLDPEPPHQGRDSKNHHWIFFKSDTFETALTLDSENDQPATDDKQVAAKMENAERKGRRGRKRNSALDLVMGRLMEMLHFEGIDPDVNIRQLSRDLSSWLMEEHGEDLSEETIRPHLASWLGPTLAKMRDNGSDG